MRSEFEFTLETGPTVEPITRDKFKTYRKVEHDREDALIDSLIIAARHALERELRRALIEQQWRATARRFPPDGLIVLRWPPFLSMVSLQYVDSQGATQALVENTDYVVNADEEPAVIEPAFGKWWPATRDVPKAVTIKWKAGYGSAASAVPEPILLALKRAVGFFYDQRDLVVPGVLAALPMDAASLLGDFRLLEVR